MGDFVVNGTQKYIWEMLEQLARLAKNDRLERLAMKIEDILLAEYNENSLVILTAKTLN